MNEFFAKDSPLMAVAFGAWIHVLILGNRHHTASQRVDVGNTSVVFRPCRCLYVH